MNPFEKSKHRDRKHHALSFNPHAGEKNHTAKIPGATTVGLGYSQLPKNRCDNFNMQLGREISSTSESGTISISHIPCMEFLKKGKH